MMSRARGKDILRLSDIRSGSMRGSQQNETSLLRLPKEHGATVAFTLGWILALSLCTANIPAAIVLMLAMWTVMLSLHRVPSFAMPAGTPKMSFGTKQTLGMAAVAALPMLVPIALDGPTYANVVAFLGFAACVLLSTATVQVVAQSAAMKPSLALCTGGMLVLILATLSAKLVALLAIPFILQTVWLWMNPKPSFKALGILETITLTTCTAILWFAI